MTPEEKQMIQDCRILILGNGGFSELVARALQGIGFRLIQQSDCPSENAAYDVIIIVADSKPATVNEGSSTLFIYPFDFIEGGAAIVVLPGDKMEIPTDVNLRVWAAKYMSGYSTFWNMGDCDWLRESFPKIEKGENSENAQHTAAKICAKISANIAVDRDVKHFPRFYLCRNLE